jgi:hypothetical protein
MMVHVRGDPMTLGPQLREIAAAVELTLRFSELQRVDRPACQRFRPDELS